MKKINSPSVKFILLSLFFLVLCFTDAFAEEPEKFVKECQPLQQYMNEGKGKFCIPCSIYDFVLKACATVVNASWAAFAVPLQGVVALGAAIYVAVYTLKTVFSFSQPNAMAYLSSEKGGVIPVLFKAAAVIYVLNDQSFIYNFLIGPSVTSGLEIGATIGGGASLGNSFGGTGDVNALFNTVIEKIRVFNDSAYDIIAYGKMFYCLSSLPDGWFNYYWHLLFFGLVFCVMGAFIMASLAFYLLDVLFRLAVGCIILPFAIACAFSSLTKKYTTSTWRLFLNVIFNFVMIGLIMSFIQKMLETAVSSSDKLLLQKMQENAVFTKSTVEELIKGIGIDFVYNILLTCVCCLISYKLFSEVDDITKKISNSGGIGNISQTIGAAAISGPLEATKSAGNVVYKFGKANVEEAAATTGRGLTNAAKSVKNGAHAVRRAVRRGFGI